MMVDSAIRTIDIDESSPRYAGWRIVAVCFVAAMCCWGFGLYSHGVYLAELNRLYGWSAWSISSATTAYYLLTAALVVFISDAIARLGPRRVVLVGACCLCGAVALFAFVTALWQLYAVYLLMAVGSATMHVASISNVLGLWFDRQRGLAISLALNGTSSGGILVAPALVIAIAAVGFATAMVGAAVVTAVILLPAVAVWIDRPPARVTATSGSGSAAAAAGWTRPAALRSFAFWSVAGPFALALMAQVGFLVHQIALLEPALGRTRAALAVAVLTVTAVAGRVALGVFALRIDFRRFTYAFGPGLLGLVRDLNGGYTAALALCVALEIAAAGTVLLPRLQRNPIDLR